jgi:hypothetical protein
MTAWLSDQDEVSRFVIVSGLPDNNNPAERGIRPLVVIRRIDGGPRSAEGMITRLALASLPAVGPF